MRNQYTYTYIYGWNSPILYFGIQSHISICIEKNVHFKIALQWQAQS